MELFIGIDPGMTGAIAAVCEGKQLVFDIPIFTTEKRKVIKGKSRIKKTNQIDPVGLTRILSDFACNFGIDNCTVGLELVHSMPQQGVAAVFTFGEGYGVIKGVIGAIGLHCELVTPHKWKKYHDLLHTEKDDARLLAQKIYPLASLDRKKDSGRADALLIAHYVQHNYTEIPKATEQASLL